MLLGRQFTITLEQCSPLFVDDPDQVIQAVRMILYYFQKGAVIFLIIQSAFQERLHKTFY